MEFEFEQRQQHELQQLRVKKAQCIGWAKQLSKEFDAKWEEQILMLAEIMEKELLILDQDWLISNISEEIIRIYRENEIKIWPYVYKFLPSRFKNKKLITSESSVTWGDRNPVVQEDSSVFSPTGTNTTTAPNSANVLVLLQKIDNMIEELPRELIADVQYRNKSINQKCNKRSEKEHIALLNDTGGSEGSSSNQAQVTIDKPQPHGSLTHDALTRTIEKLTKVRDRVFEFPPEILEKDEEIAQGWDTWASWMSPSLDLKYSKDWMHWFRTEKFRDIYGKHAAAVMSFSLTNLCANCSDEKTKEWVRMEPVHANTYMSYECLLCKYQMDTVCPNCNLSMKLMDKQVISWQCSECNGTVPMSRDLTREQVGDKSSIIIDAALEILKHIPSVIAFCIWFSDWIEPRVGGRKIRLGPDLSEKA